MDGNGFTVGPNGQAAVLRTILECEAMAQEEISNLQNEILELQDEILAKQDKVLGAVAAAAAAAAAAGAADPEDYARWEGWKGEIEAKRRDLESKMEVLRNLQSDLASRRFELPDGEP